MYIVAIAWLYVTLMMALTESSVAAGVLTIVFYGLLPCALLLWLIGTAQRRYNQSRKVAEQQLGHQDGADAEAN